MELFSKNQLYILLIYLYYLIITHVWNCGYLFCSLTYDSVLPVINSSIVQIIPSLVTGSSFRLTPVPFDTPPIFVFLFSFPYPFATPLFSVMLFGNIKFPFFSFCELRQSNNLPPGNSYWFKDENVTQFCPIHGMEYRTSVRFSEETLSFTPEDVM